MTNIYEPFKEDDDISKQLVIRETTLAIMEEEDHKYKRDDIEVLYAMLQ